MRGEEQIRKRRLVVKRCKRENLREHDGNVCEYVLSADQIKLMLFSIDWMV